MVFYEGNDATQDRLFSFSTETSRSWNCKKGDCENAEAKSVVLYQSNQVQGSTSMTVQSQKKRMTEQR